MMTARYPVISFYLMTLAFSALVLGAVVATGAGEELFILGTFGPAVAAVVMVGFRLTYMELMPGDSCCLQW